MYKRGLGTIKDPQRRIVLRDIDGNEYPTEMVGEQVRVRIRRYDTADTSTTFVGAGPSQPNSRGELEDGLRNLLAQARRVTHEALIRTRSQAKQNTPSQVDLPPDPSDLPTIATPSWIPEELEPAEADTRPPGAAKLSVTEDDALTPCNLLPSFSPHSPLGEGGGGARRMTRLRGENLYDRQLSRR